MESFFSRLSYSFGNEDWRTEREALRLKSGDRVICITGSGDRSLHLLLSDVQEVVSVDANVFQNQLLHLKAAALQTLDYSQYLSFLGARKGESPLALYPKLFSHLPVESVQFWNSHLRSISKGILYEGNVEKWCQRGAWLIGWLRRSKVKQLFSFEDIRKQRKFIREKWDNAIWKAVFAFSLHPWVTRLFLKDPGLYAHLGKNVRPGEYIRERINVGLENHLAKDALLANLVMKGRVPESALPPYLQQDTAKKIKARLPRLKIQTQNILDYLESAPDESFDAFSLSDVASYLSQEDFMRLTKAVVRTAKPNARFCMRQFMSNYQIAPQWTKYFKRDEELEKKLTAQDNCFVYRFTVGKIKKS
jgi:S-adenosylmethionine-diacylglycerol 3-amino-3-carboxypropyl transferase